MSTTFAAPPRALHPLERADIWHPTSLSGFVITDMSPEWRLNTAAALLNAAESWARRFEAYREHFTGAPVPPITDPAGWMQTTPLFVAMATGLPSKRKPLADLVARARHEGGCTFDGCGCELLDPPTPEVLAAIGETARQARIGSAR